MSTQWKLKTYLATKHKIYHATSLQRKIVNQTGVLISIQNLCNYLEKKPKRIPLRILELLITTLGCNLEDLLKITPAQVPAFSSPTKLSYQNTPHSKRATHRFPNPQDYGK